MMTGTHRNQGFEGNTTPPWSSFLLDKTSGPTDTVSQGGLHTLTNVSRWRWAPLEHKGL